MATLSDNQIATTARVAGFRGNGLQVSIAVALAESGGNPSATNQNKNSAGQVTSTDRGLWQINNVFHSEVSDTCAFNPTCAAQQAYRISSSGANWNPWTTYTTGAYQKYMNRATAAVNATGGGSTTGPVPVPTPTPTPPPGSTGGTPLTIPATTNFNLLGNTSNDVPQTQTFAYTGKNLTGAIFGPLNLIIALFLIFGVLFFIGKTRAGYVAMYYSEVLILLFLFATQSQYIKQHVSTLTGIGSQNETSYVTELAIRTTGEAGTPQPSAGNPEFATPNPPQSPPPPPSGGTFTL